MRTGYIYKITSPSGRIYIGQTVNIAERKRQYRTGFSKGQKLLHSSINKYGWDKHSFEIIHTCNESDLDFYEILFIKDFKSNKAIYHDGIGLNLSGGGAGVRGVKRPYMSERNKVIKFAGEKNGMFGKKRPDLAERNRMRKLNNEIRGKNNYQSKTVIDINTGETFVSAFEAANSTGINYSTMRYYLQNPSKSKCSLRYVA